MFGLGKRQDATVGITRQPDPAPVNPFALRLPHIDAELTKLSKQPRTVHVRVALDFWLDRRLTLRPGGEGESRDA